jgi:hypothetical protein
MYRVKRRPFLGIRYMTVKLAGMKVARKMTAYASTTLIEQSNNLAITVAIALKPT